MKNEFQNKRIKVSIIEDSEIHREWLKIQLSDETNVDVVVSVDRFGRDGIESVKRYKPDAVLLDFQLEDMTGLEVAKRLKIYDPKIRIFALTAHTEASIIQRIISDKNIDAIAIKGSPYFDSNFLPALMHIIEGGTYIDPSLLKKIRDYHNLNNLEQLTKREFEVFIQLNSGKTDENIAADLCVELSHVRNLKSRIAKKIKMSDIDHIISKIEQNSHPDSHNLTR